MSDRESPDQSPPKPAGSEYVDLPPQEEPTFPNSTEPLPTANGEIRYRYYGTMDVGLVREHNEDNFVVVDVATRVRDVPGDEIQTGVVSPSGVVFGVCDGMGGAAAGEVASQMAVDTLHDLFVSGEPTSDREVFARRLVNAIEEAGNRIFAAAKMDRSRRGMGTTSTVAGLVDGVLFVGQIGDSRCYVLRNGRLSLITKDQSLVNQLIEAGQLTEEEAEAFEHSNIILQALGTTERVVVDLTFLELRRGDRVMLCSDGLSGLMHVETIREILAAHPDTKDAAKRLVAQANDGGGHDNITCVVVDFDGEGLLPSSDAPHPTYQQYPLPRVQADPPVPERDPTMKTPIAKPGGEVRGLSSPPPSDVPWLALACLGLALLGLGGFAFYMAQPPPPPPDAPAVALPTVRVRTNDTSGELTLEVDGQTVGPLSSAQPLELPLPVGSHRFELKDTAGQVVGSATYEVRVGPPLDFMIEVEP